MLRVYLRFGSTMLTFGKLFQGVRTSDTPTFHAVADGHLPGHLPRMRALVPPA